MDSAKCKAFVVSADSGSFSRAAELLSYTPSGVSQLVNSLEEELNLQLLHRSKKGVSLTEDGASILPLIRDYIRQENIVLQTASEINGLVQGSIRIASYPSIAIHWLPEVIKAFEDDYPQVEIRMMEGMRSELCQWLDEGKANLALMGYMENMPYDWIPLADDPMMAVLPKNHPMAGSEFYPIKLCADEKFVMPVMGKDPDVLALFEKNNISPNIHYTTLANFAALSLVEKGLGISVMNELITKNINNDVAVIPLSPAEYLSFGIAVPSLDKLSPAVRRFIKYTVRYLTQAERR